MRPLTRHAQILRLRRVIIALRTRYRLVLLVLEALALHVVLAIARLAAQARVLPHLVARLALVALRLQHLARRLVLELIVLAQERLTEAAPEYPAAVLPDAALAFHAGRLLQRTRARMRLQALAAVAHPRLAMVAHGAHHAHAGGEDARMPDDAVARLQHALDLAALRANRQPLDALAEVAEGTRLLFAVGEIGEREKSYTMSSQNPAGVSECAHR